MISFTLSFLISAMAFENAIPQSDYIADEVIVKGKTYPYVLLPPKNIVEGKTYPLILFLHGAGERGRDNDKQKRHFLGLMASAKYQNLHAAFVLAPQCPQRQSWVDVSWSSKESTPYKSTAT